ncbi:H-type small acid-soluble spore protein [Paenibacillus sp. BSR1-1]|uniref:H-type small acid-soluble spore protein n=1 Tax=Bacillales TaxID=1385 RepID=UPI001CBD5FA9|nr:MULTISPECIES: H-type small acid-soluble spore protein [Bacillales]MDN3016129.1 H-type small acid-soluble spore protein [Paenibacillus sp. BSR1-1]
MNLNRVKEIFAADEEISVKYHGIPVWIESIQDTTGMALVTQRGTHDEKRLVPIDGLEEE